MRRGLLPLLTMVLLASVSGYAQQSSAAAQKPGLTFKSDVNVVEVHAVVTDANGNFVDNLTKDDFIVLEDGKPQETSVFELIDIPIERRLSLGGDVVEPDVRASSPTFEGRVYVFVLDDLHTTTLRSPLVRRAAREFIERHLGANDLAAIVYTSGRQDAAQELTASRRLLLASVDKFQGQKLPSATAERLAIHLRDRDLNRSTDSSDDSSSSSSSSPSPADPNARIDDPYDGERGMNARRALELVRDVAHWMADVRGRRKALVMFSEGIDYDIYDVFNNKSASSILWDARDAVAAAQRANVSVYAVDPRGLTMLGDEQIAIGSLSDVPTVDYGTNTGFQRELLLAQESLISLAEQTGGLAIVRRNDIAGGLERIVRDNSRYYVLGYVTDPARAPGRFRKIDVRVKRSGLEVRARRGYMPPDARAAAKKREAEVKAGTSAALSAALGNPLPVGGLPVRVFAAPFRGDGKNASALVVVELETATLKFDERDGRFTNDIEVSIVAADHHGKVRDTERQELNLKVKPETRQRLAGGGVRMLARLDLPPARYQLRVGVHESVGGGVATVPYDLEVPDFSKMPFTLSGLALTSSGAAALMTPSPDEKTKQTFPVPPSATRVFASNEVLGLYTELYDATPLAHTVDFGVTIRSVSDGRQVYKTTESRTLSAATTTRVESYRADVPLRDLAPGKYVLRLDAASRLAGAPSAAREVPFEIKDVPRSTTY